MMNHMKKWWIALAAMVLVLFSASPAQAEEQSVPSGPVVLRVVQPPKNIVKYKGCVGVHATIGEDGHVTKTSIPVSSGNRAVDEIAMSIVRQWEFRPALDADGKPVEVIASIPICFR